MPRPIRGWLRAIALLAAVSVATPAVAQTSDVKAAEKAFDEAMELMKAGRYPEACAKLEESQRIDAGMATQFRLAQCYEADGRIASGWKNYSAVATGARALRVGETDQTALDNLAAREKYAQERADALLAKVSKLIIQVSADIASLPGLEVSVDGVVAPPASWGSIPIDRGERAIVAVADGKEPWAKTLKVDADGMSLTLRVPPLAEARIEAPPAVLPRADEQAGEMGPVGIAGLVIGGVGVIGMGVGIALGMVAKSDHDDSAPHCNDADECTPEGIAIRDDARGLGNVATAVFIAGAALGVGGFITWRVAPADAPNDVAMLDVDLTPLPGGAYGTMGVRF